MKIKEITCRRLQIPMQLAFAQSNNSATHSDSIVLSVELTDGVIGYGECCPRLYVTGEDTNSVLRDVLKIAERLKNSHFKSLKNIRELIETGLRNEVGASTICAIETALLDAFGKCSELPVTQLLGIKLPEKVRYSGIVPMMPIAALPAFLKRLCYFDFKEIKLKIGGDLSDSLERIKRIKSYFGEDIQLRIDANCAWDLKQAQAQIPVLCEAGVQVFEQIFPPEQEQEWAEVTALFGRQTQLMADESLTTFESAERLIEKGIGNRFNLKISKQGGLFNTLKISDLAKANGIPCQLGAHYGETSILTTCGIILKAIAGPLAAMEGGFGTHLLTADVCTNTLQFNRNACIDFPEKQMTRYGLGFEVAPALLEKFSVAAV